MLKICFFKLHVWYLVNYFAVFSGQLCCLCKCSNLRLQRPYVTFAPWTVFTLLDQPLTADVIVTLLRLQDVAKLKYNHPSFGLM